MFNRVFWAALFILILVPFLSFAQEGTTSTTTEATEDEPAQEDMMTPAPLEVEAQICTGIEERMPVGGADSFSPDVDKLYLWSRISGAQDSTSVHHVWSYEGEEKLNFEIPVKSSSWRCWTYKTILPEWTGQWEAKVIGPDGTVMATIPFTITEQTETEQTETE